MNKLVGCKAFDVGPTVEACTKGIWLWSEPIRIVLSDGVEAAVLFIDTEGIGATGATADHDARIFSLGTLLSSLLIFNSSGPIDEEAIQSLAFVANLTQHIRSQLGTGTEKNTISSSVLEVDAYNLSAGFGEEYGAISATGVERQQNRKIHSRIIQESVAQHSELPHDSDFDSDSDADYVTDLKCSQLKLQANRVRAEQSRAPSSRNDSESNRTKGISEPSIFFPSFLWILRDFSLDLLDDAGQRMTASEYLESCLLPQEGFSSDIQSRNRTRRLLTGFFKERYCATLVRPVESESLLQVADTLPDDQIRSLFLLQMADLRKLILEELVRPKTMCGRILTGRMLANLASTYVDAVNHNAVPSIGQAWNDISRVECKDAFDTARKRFSECLMQTVPRHSFPFDVDVLSNACDECRVISIDDFDAKAVGPSVSKYKSQLRAAIDEECRLLHAENAVASEESCTRLITTLWTEIIEAPMKQFCRARGALLFTCTTRFLTTLLF